MAEFKNSRLLRAKEAALYIGIHPFDGLRLVILSMHPGAE